MYKVFVDDTLVCDSRVEELALSSPVVQLEENKVGSFSFIIPPKHPYYDLIRRRKSVVRVIEDDELVFCGPCIDVTKDFYKQKEIYCEGELTYFNDSVQRPARFRNVTIISLLQAYVANHNLQVEEKKHFQVGMVTVTSVSGFVSYDTNMEHTIAYLKKLVDDLGGFFRIRYEDGVRYLDYLAESLNTNSQVIKLGQNLIDFKSNLSSADIATAIIPLGEKLEETTVEGVEVRQTIISINDGIDYVFSPEAVENFGWIYKTVKWDGVTRPETLMIYGERYLSDIKFENVVIQAKAVDMHLADKAVERFKLSDQIRVLSAPHGMDRYFRLTKMTKYLNNPESNPITLGREERLSLSTKSQQENAEIKKAIEAISPNSIVKEAVANATQIIKNAMNGYITTVLNDDGTPKELLIMDTNSTETATKVWRWNINGLGYSKTGYDGKYALAMTMDGAIVADMITAGTMKADRIKGGILKIGGSANVNGVIEVLDTNGNVVGKWNKDGITLPDGTKINSAVINGGTITGTTIDGTEINGATINGSKIKSGNGAITIEDNNLIFDTSGRILCIYQDDGCEEDEYRYADIINSEPDGRHRHLHTNIGYDVTNIIGSELNIACEGIENEDEYGYSGYGVNIYSTVKFYETAYVKSGAVVTSDRDCKRDISELDSEKTAQFVYSLKPSQFKYNDGTSDRFHHGLIAQEVKDAMGANDWGLYVDANPERIGEKALRYEELIADLIATVQTQNQRIKQLEERLGDING